MDSSSSTKEVTYELPGLIRIYKDGSIERIFGSPIVPPSPAADPETGVSSKDITISKTTGLKARLFLPKLSDDPAKKLPILVYYHGGGFFLESAFSFLDHRYMNIISSQAQVLVVSVDYRLAPEHPLPAAYEDSWTALQWVSSNKDEPWLTQYGDLDALFIGGDSCGGNIVHNMAIRAGSENLPCDVKILGAALSQPYFLNSESVNDERLKIACDVWSFVYPDAPGGFDNVMINPVAPGAPGLDRLGCSKMLVLVAGNDELKGLDVEYCDAVKKSGFSGSVELFEVEDEGHGFHIFDTDTDNARLVFQRLASFLKK